MTESITVARPYARAVFETAQRHDQLGNWSDMLAAMAAVACDGDMRAALDSPRLTDERAAELFVSCCEDWIDDGGRNLARLLAEHDRLVLLPDIAALYETLRARAEDRIDAEVISAQALDEQHMTRIRQALHKRLGREVNLTSRIDESLIGGAVIQAGDLVIDGSVRGKLNRLSTTLSH